MWGWEKNGLTPHCPPSLREFELQTIWFLGWCCINHLQRTCWPYSKLICDTRSVCCYINRRLLYKHWNVFNQTSPSKQRFPCNKVGFCAYVQFHYSCAELKPPNLFPWKIWIMWTWIWWRRLSLLIFILWTGSPILSNVWTNMLGSL